MRQHYFLNSTFSEMPRLSRKPPPSREFSPKFSKIPVARRGNERWKSKRVRESFLRHDEASTTLLVVFEALFLNDSSISIQNIGSSAKIEFLRGLAFGFRRPEVLLARHGGLVWVNPYPFVP